MKTATPVAIRRLDYTPCPFVIESVDLHFELVVDATVVTTEMVMRRDGDAQVPLQLDGEDLTLLEIGIDGTPLQADAYSETDGKLTIHATPAQFTLRTKVQMSPEANTELSGLYRSGDMYCTQCEAEGFRRITYFLDRPDVMTTYRTTLVADKASCPVLLSNGNRVDSGDLEGGRHFVTWVDPHKKPSYLFALVAGDLDHLSGDYTTKSGRKITLEVYTDKGKSEKADHALQSLKRAMKWDEDTFNLEYDLDIYMVVAAADFNMGAMENKGLNIFNAKFVLADDETATDDDYELIEGIIGHEYFHNWTGNRVTCRDWFQLTLKEGLTVFRDEQFSADMTDPAVKRIQDVRDLRERQLPEDQSPMVHPIRPESYIEMDNFYTATVYQKGAAVIRMYHTLLGDEGFKKGMALYFERHDGQAVTCDDFLAAMADANGRDLSQFARWYSQPGTPVLRAEGHYNEEKQQYALTLTQDRPKNPSVERYEPMHIPVRVGLVGQTSMAPLPFTVGAAEGGAMQTGNAQTSHVLELTTATGTFLLEGVTEAPVCSVLQDHTAPVELEMSRTPEDLALLARFDSDPYTRWDAFQTLAAQYLSARAEELHNQKTTTLSETRDALSACFLELLTDSALQGSLKAMTLSLPTPAEVGSHMAVVHVEAIFAAMRELSAFLGQTHEEALLEAFKANSDTGPYRTDNESIARRRLKNRALAYLVATGSEAHLALAEAQALQAMNMTDVQSALVSLSHQDADAFDRAMTAFEAKWQDNALVMDKWFSLHANATRAAAFDQVKALAGHPAFTLRNPNRARSLLGVFAGMNELHFHRADGAGYTFVTDKTLEADAINPRVAVRLIQAFRNYRRYDDGRKALMRAALERIAAHGALSKDSREVVEKLLGR